MLKFLPFPKPISHLVPSAASEGIPVLTATTQTAAVLLWYAILEDHVYPVHTNLYEETKPKAKHNETLISRSLYVLSVDLPYGANQFSAR